ncbi:MAG: ABC transporter permease subunit [Gemmatimonadota bacterium]|nr:MAG: ABC transporter permease subunit [Gemmatimonadota bacterium]
MATSVPLQAASSSGWLVGFRNVVDKEYASWWRTRRWLTHLILWFVVINAFIFLVGADGMRRHAPEDVLAELIEVFLRVGGLWTAIGIVVSTQSAVLGERQLGTAQWVLSKPLTRPAFLLSKLLVNGLSFLFLAVLIPTVVFFLQTLWHALSQPQLGPFLAGMLFHVEHLVFYLALTLALGTFFTSRGPVSGAAIGFLFAGFILPNIFPSTLEWLPWALPELSATAALGRPLPVIWYVPVITTVMWTVLCVLAALWRFEREEF